MQQPSVQQHPMTNVPNGELSIKERLPSNNISFQSASICTVSEVYSAQSARKSNVENLDCTSINSASTTSKIKSSSSSSTEDNTIEIQHEMDVRVTGVVIYTDLRHDFIIVGDPLHKPTSTRANTRTTTSSSTRNTLSFSPLFGSFNTRAVKSALKTPSSGHSSSNERIQSSSVLNNTKTKASIVYQTPLHKKHLKYDTNHNSMSYKTPNTKASCEIKTTAMSKSASTSTSTPLIGSIKKRKLISVKKNFGSSNKLLSKKKDRKLIYQPKFKSISTPSSSSLSSSSSSSAISAPACIGVSANTRTIHYGSNNQQDENKNDTTNEQNGKESLDSVNVSTIASSSSMNESTTVPLPQTNQIILNQKKDVVNQQHNHKDNLHHNNNNNNNNNNNIDPKLLKLIQQNINQGMKMIFIDIKSGQNDIQWKDGDLIMIIGKYLVFDMQGKDEEKEEKESKDDHMETMNRIVMKLNNIFDEKNSMKQQKHGDDSGATGSYIEARIVKNVNGADVNLLHQALLLRRQYLERIQSIV